MPLDHFQNFQGFLRTVFHSLPNPMPSLLVSRAAGQVEPCAPGLTSRLETPLVNSAPLPRELGLRSLGISPSLLLCLSLILLSPGWSAGSSPRPPLPHILAQGSAFIRGFSFNRAKSWLPVPLAWLTSKPDPDSWSWVPTGRGSHRFKKLWTAKSQTICTLFFRLRRYLCVWLCTRC